MHKTGQANLPLHGGQAPAWLFKRMVPLSAAISEIIIRDFGLAEYLKRLSDPFWFQSFGCVLGFDWHSSGLTTTVCGALKEGLKDFGQEYGIFVCGGKGKTSRKTPQEIEEKAPYANIGSKNLVYASKMSAKVDNTAIQDGFQLYHHTFIFTKTGQWTVIQQGMNPETKYARRYHWLSLNDDIKYTLDPHSAIISAKKENSVLNMVSSHSIGAQKTSLDISKNKPDKTIHEWKKLQEFTLPQHHDIREIRSENLRKIMIATYEDQPETFEELLATPGLGPKSLRALALMSELIYGDKPSYEDPAKFSFTHGGKDGIPYPVDRNNYDNSIKVLQYAIDQAKIGDREKFDCLKKISLVQQSLI